MSPIKTALIVGGGIAGMSAAIALRRLGIAVDLVDLDPEWRVYGAGITITGPTLRAMKALGVLEEIMAAGHTADGLRVSAVDGRIIEEIATPDPTGSGVPGAGGILRPALHGILSRHTLAAGAVVRLGLTVTAIVESGGSIEASFSDGGSGRYDLVVGADGLFSTTRGLLFPQAPQPRYTGQICWRLMLARPPALDRRHYFLGGPG
jgi:2-polyprenyl-6-methoxyphenol hydroxylase-like FAD-dependent oxidoreductase